MASVDATHMSDIATSTPQPPSLDTATASQESNDTLQFTIHHHGEPIPLSLPSSATIADLSTAISSAFSIPPSNQKFMITPKVGLLKPPFKDPTLALSTLVSKKIVLMGNTTDEITTLATQIAASAALANKRPGGNSAKPPAASKARNWQQVQEDAQYTFHTLRPLPHLPRPERSLRFLERLKEDPGIRFAMRKHKYSVPLLTEMDPAEHTTHESRTLGLNRNRGEVIELRLRTDAYDGYRDYKTIRKTLCHELAHNVWGEHDRNFWNLCREIEAEVDKGDWTRGGRSVGQEEFYNPQDDMLGAEVMDHGGWTGGEFVLGGQGQAGTTGLSTREVLAKAAEERVNKGKQVQREKSDQAESSKDVE